MDGGIHEQKRERDLCMEGTEWAGVATLAVDASEEVVLVTREWLLSWLSSLRRACGVGTWVGVVRVGGVCADFEGPLLARGRRGCLGVGWTTCCCCCCCSVSSWLS